MIGKLQLTTFTFLIIFCLTLKVSYGCDSPHGFDHSTCVFYMNYLDSSCNNFNFQQCSWEECVAWDYSNNQTTCIQYDTFYDNSWSYCTNLCCESDVNYPQNADSINKCQEYITLVFKRTLIIVFSIIGGILLIVGISVLCCCCRDRLGNCCSAIGDCCSAICECMAYIFTCRCFRNLFHRHPEPIAYGNSIVK